MSTPEPNPQNETSWEPTSDAAPSVAGPVERFFLHNTSHARHTRAARASLPRGRAVQYVGGIQLRGNSQPQEVTKVWLLANIEAIRAGEAAGRLEVRNGDNRRIDLNTFEVVPGAPAQNTTPVVTLDSVNNDKNYPFPKGYRHVSQERLTDETPPEVLQPGEKPALFDSAEEHADLAAELKEAAVAAGQDESAFTPQEKVSSDYSKKKKR